MSPPDDKTENNGSSLSILPTETLVNLHSYNPAASVALTSRKDNAARQLVLEEREYQQAWAKYLSPQSSATDKIKREDETMRLDKARDRILDAFKSEETQAQKIACQFLRELIQNAQPEIFWMQWQKHCLLDLFSKVESTDERVSKRALRQIKNWLSLMRNNPEEHLTKLDSWLIENLPSDLNAMPAADVARYVIKSHEFRTQNARFHCILKLIQQSSLENAKRFAIEYLNSKAQTPELRDAQFETFNAKSNEQLLLILRRHSLLEHFKNAPNRKEIVEQLNNPKKKADDAEQRLLELCKTKDSDLKEFLSLLASGVQLNCVDSMKNTPLHLAAKSGNQPFMAALIAAGANLEAKNKDEHTPLMVATFSQQESSVKALIDSDADINAKTSQKSTAVSLAIQAGATPILVMLLQNHAEYITKNSDKFSSLRTALEYGRVDSARVLLQLPDINGVEELKMFADGNNFKGILTLLIAGMPIHTATLNENMPETTYPSLRKILDLVTKLDSETNPESIATLVESSKTIGIENPKELLQLQQALTLRILNRFDIPHEPSNIQACENVRDLKSILTRALPTSDEAALETNKQPKDSTATQSKQNHPHP